ncbi:hypothetical protein BT69DRAFT_1325613, partial [Atractiella rhizophila]
MENLSALRLSKYRGNGRHSKVLEDQSTTVMKLRNLQKSRGLLSDGESALKTRKNVSGLSGGVSENVYAVTSSPLQQLSTTKDKRRMEYDEEDEWEDEEDELWDEMDSGIGMATRMGPKGNSEYDDEDPPISQADIQGPIDGMWDDVLKRIRDRYHEDLK